MALSGLEEFAIAPTERPRAWTVAFLSGLTQPRICGGKLLLPRVSESHGGDEKVAFFCFLGREKACFFFYAAGQRKEKKEGAEDRGVGGGG